MSVYNFSIIFVVVFLLFPACSQIAAVSQSKVEFLPGFEGQLPVQLETGYVGVDKSEDAQLFYYFIKSQRNSKEDPLLLWLTGGPGCSSLSGLLFEVGPLRLKVERYNGSLPSLVLNPHSWTQVANIIFLDLPVGSGFSYARSSLSASSGDFIQARQAVEFLRKWLIDHSEFQSHPVYIAGSSYSGITIPAIVRFISSENEDVKRLINVKGYVLGNPVTDTAVEMNFRIPFSHGMGLISDELYQALLISCGGEFSNIDPANSECLKNMANYHKITSRIGGAHILEHYCARASPKPLAKIGTRRSLYQDYFLDFGSQIPDFKCRSYGLWLSNFWANDNSVKRALHVQEGSIKKWQRCNYEIPYSHDIFSAVNYHKYLSNKGFRSLIFSGDHDMLVPFLSTQAWIRSLNYSIVDDWRPWYTEGQVAGFTRTYSNQMTFATVKGGGHTAAEHKPAECLPMFKRWIDHEAL